MCGVAGVFCPERGAVADIGELARAMADRLAHRGPDDSGVWVDDRGFVALSHRRLSILDLSPAGHQPMVSSSGRYVIVLNGEIYNYLELRQKLGEREWRGHSDTETLLACIESWGLEATLRECVGMFALMLWDRAERTLSLARDRMGEKPLYYGWAGGHVVVGSELKALKQHPAFSREVDRGALISFLRHGYIPAPWSIYQNVRKIAAGTIVRFTTATQVGSWPAPIPYWSLSETVAAALRNPFTGDIEEAAIELESKLNQAICLQRTSDVPVGAFLSGGIDSSAIVALMQAQSSRPLKTFTIGFYEKEYDEARYAAAVAGHLGTDHVEHHVTADQARTVIPQLPSIYDEPFGDSSQIPTLLLSKLAREHVSVALSGDGGDELFGGYGRYFNAPRVLRKLHSVPAAVRALVGPVLRVVQPHVPAFLSPERAPTRMPFHETLLFVTQGLQAAEDIDFYRILISQWRMAGSIVSSASERPALLADRRTWPALKTLEDRMLFGDALTYLPDDVLVKVDRAAMAVALETRVPLLDHRVVEFAWRLPQSMRIQGRQSKEVLRRVVAKYVPAHLFDRPKMGFGVPIDTWLRGPLREWVEDLLSEQRLRSEGFLNPGPIRQRWQEHVTGRYNWRDCLWIVLMFQAWVAAQKEA